MSRLFGPANRVTVNQAAHRAAVAPRQSLQRSRIIMPPRAALAQVVVELVQTPPTDDELRLLTEVAREAQEQNLEPEQIEARIGDTRFWQLLRILADNDVRILTYLMALLMIIQVVNDLSSRPQPVPAPQVTVNNNVTVDTGEIAEEVTKQLEERGLCEPRDPKPGKTKPNSGKTK